MDQPIDEQTRRAAWFNSALASLRRLAARSEDGRFETPKRGLIPWLVAEASANGLQITTNQLRTHVYRPMMAAGWLTRRREGRVYSYCLTLEAPMSVNPANIPPAIQGRDLKKEGTTPKSQPNHGGDEEAGRLCAQLNDFLEKLATELGMGEKQTDGFVRPARPFALSGLLNPPLPRAEAEEVVTCAYKNGLIEERRAGDTRYLRIKQPAVTLEQAAEMQKFWREHGAWSAQGDSTRPKANAPDGGITAEEPASPVAAEDPQLAAKLEDAEQLNTELLDILTSFITTGRVPQEVVAGLSQRVLAAIIVRQLRQQ